HKKQRINNAVPSQLWQEKRDPKPVTFPSDRLHPRLYYSQQRFISRYQGDSDPAGQCDIDSHQNPR
ncbi:MAG: hypothetical protein ACPGPS_18110, partial [Rubripirellula sp.]